jgi:hypothetical protein
MSPKCIQYKCVFFLSLLSSFASAFAFADDTGMTTPTAGKSATPGSSIMNPNISLDGLFSLSQFNRPDPITFNEGHDPRGNGFTLQQVEMAFNSAVDPYLRADAFLVLTPGKIEVEEAYATTESLPAGFQIKAGQFFTDFGRNNPTHPHSWDFADKPLVLGRYFGGDGLRNPGAEVSWLSPLPWYSELITSVQNSVGDTAVSFRPGGQPAVRNLSEAVLMARWNNFIPFTDELGLNAAVSFLNGANASGTDQSTKILGADLYLKYRGDGLSYFALQAEALERFYGTPSQTFTDWGWYAQAVYRLGGAWTRWFIGLRFDQIGPKSAPVITASNTVGGTVTDLDTAGRWRIAPVITFYPTEFSKLRLQYDYDSPSNLAPAQQVAILQFEFLIGAHGAHRF